MFRASLCPSSGEQDTIRAATHFRLTQEIKFLQTKKAKLNSCSNIRLVLLKMGIMMPETCWEIVKNKHLTVASCWFSLSLHNLLTMHGHRNLKLEFKKYYCYYYYLQEDSCINTTFHIVTLFGWPFSTQFTRGRRCCVNTIVLLKMITIVLETCREM